MEFEDCGKFSRSFCFQTKYFDFRLRILKKYLIIGMILNDIIVFES